MIILKHNNGIPIGEIPEKYVATLSIGTDMIFFESRDEYNSYMNEKYPNTEELWLRTKKKN